MEILISPLIVLGLFSVLLLAVGIRRLVSGSVGGGVALIVAGLVVAGAGALLVVAVSLRLGA